MLVSRYRQEFQAQLSQVSVSNNSVFACLGYCYREVLQRRGCLCSCSCSIHSLIILSITRVLYLVKRICALGSGLCWLRYVLQYKVFVSWISLFLFLNDFII